MELRFDFRHDGICFFRHPLSPVEFRSAYASPTEQETFRPHWIFTSLACVDTYGLGSLYTPLTLDIT